MDLNKQVRTYRDDMVGFLSELVRIPSLEQPPEPGAPFGKPCHDALTLALEHARSLGFTAVKDIDGYAGYIEVGEGEKELGVLAHVDVVPEGTGWTQEPYGGHVVNNRVYGRGAMDDKGAVSAALYAIKALLDTDAEFKMRVRLIIGCNEETGMRCMDYYKTKEKMSDFGFSPDADYPVINMEKGILHLRFTKGCKPTGEGMYIAAASAGERPNVVPGLAEASIGGATLQEIEHALGDYDRAEVALLEDGGLVRITMQGKYGHAAMPEGGENAAAKLCQLLQKLPLADGAMEQGFATIAKYTKHYDGAAMGLDITDESGPLTCNLGILNAGDDGLSFVLDIRHPVTFEHQYVLDKLQASICKEGFAMELMHAAAAHCVPTDHPLVETLMRVYKEQTGRDEGCLSTGGGTYARVLPNRAVAFGIHFLGTPDTVHQPDEYIDIDELVKDAEIIANAIKELACTDVLL